MNRRAPTLLICLGALIELCACSGDTSNGPTPGAAGTNGGAGTSVGAGTAGTTGAAGTTGTAGGTGNAGSTVASGGPAGLIGS
jgi:hypothetical protein